MTRRKGITGARRQTARQSSAWPRPSVLVIGKEAQLLDLLHLGFSYEGFDVSVATSPSTALRAGAVRRPDLILLDTSLHLDTSSHQVGSSPDELSDLIHALRAEGGDAALLVLGNQMDDGSAALQRWLRDADGYVSQPFVFGELMARARALLARRGKGVAGRLSFEDVTLDRERHLVTRGEHPIELTLREFELLELFLRHPDQVLRRSAILESIWGAGYAGADNILDVYIHLLRAKLGDHPPRLIRTVRGVGYILCGPGS